MERGTEIDVSSARYPQGQKLGELVGFCQVGLLFFLFRVCREQESTGKREREGKSRFSAVRRLAVRHGGSINCERNSTRRRCGQPVSQSATQGYDCAKTVVSPAARSLTELHAHRVQPAPRPNRVGFGEGGKVRVQLRQAASSAASPAARQPNQILAKGLAAAKPRALDALGRPFAPTQLGPEVPSASRRIEREKLGREECGDLRKKCEAGPGTGEMRRKNKRVHKPGNLGPGPLSRWFGQKVRNWVGSQIGRLELRETLLVQEAGGGGRRARGHVRSP